MADPRVIREFLVSLGFRVNHSQLHHMTTNLNGATKSVAALGAAFATAALEVEGAVALVAHQIENLYFLSQRADAAAQNIGGLRYAAEQVGVGADKAAAALVSLAYAMRTQPGVEGLLNNLGIQTRINNQMRDGGDVMNELIARFRTMPFYLANQYAQLLGIDTDTLYMMMRNWGELQANVEEYNKSLARAGLNQNEVAQTSHTFMSKVRELRMEIEVLGQLIFERLEPIAYRMLGWLEKGIDYIFRMDKATHGWSTAIGFGLVAALGAATVAWRLFNIAVLSSPVGGMILLLTALGAALYALYEDYDRWTKTGQSLIDWDKWKEDVDRVIVAAKELWGTIEKDASDFEKWLQDNDVFKGIGDSAANPQTAEKLWNLRQALEDIRQILQVITDLANGNWARAWTGDRANTAPGKGMLGRAWEWFKGLADPNSPGSVAAGSGGDTSKSWSAPPGSQELPFMWQELQQEQYGNTYGQYRRSRSRLGTTTPPISLAPVGSLDELVRRVIGAESGTQGQSATSPVGAHGLMQLMPGTAADEAKKFGETYDPSDAKQNVKFGTDYLQGLIERYQGNIMYALAAYNWGMDRVDKWISGGADPSKLPSETHDYIQKILGSSVWNDPMSQFGATSLLPAGTGGSSSVSLNQKTDIHVLGGDDAIATGRAVANQQGRVNGDMVRNAAGALR